ncbi:uncharacterized protein LOC118648537 isoform X3 [Monomorium pharaonis]|uniref:uncharacterized protein LOC118648537 isoform X3 n=2 Tax=Monomorium pharaonis TaxID=307658 RepID=UPI0017460A2B|nr:uncharacterized protein LOC118648537 isoform X3 [Monomorium pharaonis]
MNKMLDYFFHTLYCIIIKYFQTRHGYTRNVGLIFDHPSDDDDNFPHQREFHFKVPDFFENIVSAYSLTDFKSHFRLEKATYERLVQSLGGRLRRDRGAEKMSPDKQIAITLWILGNQEVYRQDMDIQGMWDLFFDHPSDDDDNFPHQREFHFKVPDFFENIVSAYSLTDFKSHFRLEKATYERLVQSLGGRLRRDRGAEKMSPDKQIAITLWILGNQEVYS